MREHLDQILELLDSGEKKTKEIFKAINVSEQTAQKYINKLIKEKKVVRVQKGLYDLHEDYRPLTYLENRKIVKDLIHFQRDLLNVCNKDLKALLNQPEPNAEEKQRLLDCAKTLSLSIDRLLKRWNLLTQGYDASTHQAHEDAKQKTENRKNQELENTPPEKRLRTIREYNESMRDILEKMPPPLQEENEA